MKKHGIVISDLHLFTTKSIGHQKIVNRLKYHLKSKNFCVLNGDIFDFEWSKFKTINMAYDKSVKFLDKICQHFSKCHFYFIAGNHDCDDAFIRQLTKAKIKNLTICETHLILKRKLFLHGDLVFKSDPNPFERPIHSTSHVRSKFMNMLYDLVLFLRIHKIIKRFFGPRFCARKITKAINKNSKKFLKDIDDIYFGHTHNSFNNYLFKKIRFHNSGSGVKYLDMNIIEVEI